MAQIEQSSGNGKKKKGAQKKMAIHVDFTPMVDMNMLLITFFMLCTTMIKSQTLSIALPTNEKLEQTELQKAKESEAITLILDTDYDDNGGIKGNTIYYYTGKPVVEYNGTEVLSSNLQETEFLGNDGKLQQGVRKILHDRNRGVLKPLPGASWESVISALDEMQINQISRYQLGTLTEVDEAMVGDYKLKHKK